MPIIREQNWTKQDSEDTGFSVRIQDPDEITDWYKPKYTKLLGRFKGEVFDCIIRTAYMTEFEFKKNGADLKAESLHLICFVRNSMNYLDVSIIARTKIKDRDTGSWSEWSNNSTALNDLLEIVCRQKTNFLEHYTYSTGYEERESYPHFCGTSIKVLAVAAELKTSSKGKFYDRNSFAIFDPDCHSGWELKNGIKDKLDFRVAVEDFAGIYKTFCETNKLPYDFINCLQTQEEEEPEPPSTPIPDEDIDDALPF